MELKNTHLAIMGGLRRVPYVPVENYKPLGSIVVHLHQVGFIGVHLVNKVPHYYLTKAGYRELRTRENPPDEAAEIRAEIARLETALAAAKGRLEALMGEGE